LKLIIRRISSGFSWGGSAPKWGGSAPEYCLFLMLVFYIHMRQNAPTKFSVSKNFHGVIVESPYGSDEQRLPTGLHTWITSLECDVVIYANQLQELPADISTSAV